MFDLSLIPLFDGNVIVDDGIVTGLVGVGVTGKPAELVVHRFDLLYPMNCEEYKRIVSLFEQFYSKGGRT